MSILMLPTTIAGFFPNNGFAAWITRVLSYQHPAYMVTYALLILFFTYFYTAVTFNPADVAENLKKNGGFIPGLRPGRPTAEYLDKIMTRITLAGAVFLAVIALMPYIAIRISGLNIYFGGTSLLIVVGVALDTMKQLESHMLMRHYQGFMK
ncbi:Protein translocase subunit SecY [bioreactor metagenome]|uniref:Protein translocase subunit SecY n=1 Tax=bioreactor metagenome TaxID=1076179 RepID=A0A645H188_9ZZZZ